MKFRSIIFLTLAALMVVAVSAQTPSGGKRVVDFRAEEMRNLRQANDSMGWILVDKVVFHHNGAVITCDSAVRYNERRMECFGNVVINQNDTYVYGDRADYNGERNEARVYAPIVKIVDKDATMYTYHFSYNTLTSVGTFWGTGTLSQQDNLFESERGYYYTDTRTMVGVERAELRNEEYELQGDSITYNMNTRIAEFHTPSTIWNRTAGEILVADRGSYDRASSTYHFPANAYLLNATQEMWADHLDYNATTQDAVLRRNIQIRDEDNSVMAFGDHGLYFGEAMEAMLTDNPSAIRFDPEGVEDTLYMRGDSMFLYTTIRQQLIAPPASSASAVDPVMVDSLSIDSLPLASAAPDPLILDSMELAPAAVDSVIFDSVVMDSLIPDSVAVMLPAVEFAQEPAPDSTAVPAAAIEAVTMELPNLDSMSEMPAPVFDTLFDTLRIVRAYRDVKIFRNDFQAVCDSLVAFSVDSTAHMYIDPMMWNGDNQISSDSVTIFSKNQQLDRALFEGGQPIMVGQIDRWRYNQIKGKTITAHFRDNDIYRTDVDGNGQALYYMTEQDTLGQLYLTGFITIECAGFSFYTHQQELQRMTAKGSPVYEIFPIEMINIPERLPGFVWQPERRPSLRQVFYGRTIRPSQRTRYEGLPRPRFPLSESIHAHIVKMIGDGFWHDRNDVLSEETLQYLETLQ